MTSLKCAEWEPSGSFKSRLIFAPPTFTFRQIRQLSTADDMEGEFIYETDLQGFGGGSQGNGTEDSVATQAVDAITQEISTEGMDVESEIAIGAIGGGVVVDGGLICSSDFVPLGGGVGVVPPVEISTEEQLRSSEKLDRSSPDLWPQNLPTAAQHIIAKNSLKSDQQSLGIWAQGLDPEDINLLHQFGSLTSSSLVEEVKKLQNIAYQLGLEETKEMTRGKLLHVLDESDVASAREQARYVQSLWKN